MTYKKLYIQQQTSAYANVGSAVDTQTQWHVVCREFPFRILPETKEPATRDWHDEDGEDTYIPSEGLKAKAYDVDVTFLYVGTQANMVTELDGFVKFILGRNTGGSSLLAFYDEYTKTGRRGVYVKEVGNDFLLYDDANPEVVGEFKVKFRVTDPVTKMTYNNGNVVTAT